MENKAAAYKEACLVALSNFIEDASNENKLEIYMAYEDEDEQFALNALGEDLNAVFIQILRENHHDDAFLAKVKSTYNL